MARNEDGLTEGDLDLNEPDFDEVAVKSLKRAKLPRYDRKTVDEPEPDDFSKTAGLSGKAIKVYTAGFDHIPKATDESNFELAKAGRYSEMYQQNLRLVVSIAKDYHRKNNDRLMDLIQVGNESLQKAIDSYDPLKGVPFANWAGPIIRCDIIDAMRHERSVSPKASDRSDRAYGDEVEILVPALEGRAKRIYVKKREWSKSEEPLFDGWMDGSIPASPSSTEKPKPLRARRYWIEPGEAPLEEHGPRYSRRIGKTPAVPVPADWAEFLTAGTDSRHYTGMSFGPALVPEPPVEPRAGVSTTPTRQPCRGSEPWSGQVLVRFERTASGPAWFGWRWRFPGSGLCIRLRYRAIPAGWRGTVANGPTQLSRGGEAGGSGRQVRKALMTPNVAGRLCYRL